MITYTSRTLTEADIKAVFHLFSTAYSYAKDNVRAQEGIRSDLLRSVSFLCLDDERIVGHTSVRQSEHEAMLSLLLVDPEYRRRGIGRQLMQQAVAQFEGKQKLVHSSPIAFHPHSQHILLAEESGWYPTQISLGGSGQDLGAGQDETLIHVAKLFGIQPPKYTAYLPLEYHYIARRTLQPFCQVQIQEGQRQVTSELEQELQSGLKKMLQYKMFPLDLDKPFVPWAIEYIQAQGYYCAGFSPRIKQGQLTFAVYMARTPHQGLDKENFA